jgi:hypothetical protein
MASITQGDLYPPFRGYVRDQNGLVDLTAASSLSLVFKCTSPSTLVVVVPTAIALPGELDADGITRYNFKYQWVSGDTDVPGTYSVALKATWSSARPQYFPNTLVYGSLTINPKLN